MTTFRGEPQKLRGGKGAGRGDNAHPGLCRDCKDADASEASGRCSMCAEEMAYMLGDLHNEFGGEPLSAEYIRKQAYGY